MLLVAYADGELGSEDARKVEKLLETDPRARQQVNLYRETAAWLRAACAEPVYRDAPQRITQTLQSARPRTPRRQLLAIAASLLLGIVGFGVGYGVGGFPRSQYDALIEEIFEYHSVFAREPVHLAEIPASRRSELQDWLSERLGRPLVTPDLTSHGFTFAGGRMLVVNGRPVAQLLYTRPGSQPLGVCVTKLQDAPEPFRFAHDEELNLVSWREGSYTYAIVGDVGDTELRQLAQLVAANSRG